MPSYNSFIYNDIKAIRKEASETAVKVEEHNKHESKKTTALIFLTVAILIVGVLGLILK